MTGLLERFHAATHTGDFGNDDCFDTEAHVVTGEPPRSATKPPPIVDDLDDPEWLPL